VSSPPVLVLDVERCCFRQVPYSTMGSPRTRREPRCGLCPPTTRTGGILPSPLMGPYNMATGSNRRTFVHQICALWAPEVYTEEQGSLRNVMQAYRRGRHMRCTSCGSLGATVGCQVNSCQRVFHFLCLQRGRCAFVQARYAAWCSRHVYIIGDEADKGNLSAEGPSLDDQGERDGTDDEEGDEAEEGDEGDKGDEGSEGNEGDEGIEGDDGGEGDNGEEAGDNELGGPRADVVDAYESEGQAV